MINPTKADIKIRRVYYKRDYMMPDQYEYGIITGFNDSFVFVRYGTDTGSKATRREDLHWAESVRANWFKRIWRAITRFFTSKTEPM